MLEAQYTPRHPRRDTSDRQSNAGTSPETRDTGDRKGPPCSNLQGRSVRTFGEITSDAELLAEAVDQGLSGQRTLDDALAAYEERRNAAVLPIYEMTRQLARLAPPPPEMQQLFAALRRKQEQSQRFWGTVSGATPIAEFFAPDNIARILKASLAPVA